MNNMDVEAVNDCPVLYHGTRQPFARGGLLLPVSIHGGQPRPGHAGKDSKDWVYVTPDHDVATYYALNTHGRAIPRILTVQPLSAVYTDPTVYDIELEQYRCEAAQVRGRRDAKSVAHTDVKSS